MLVDPKPEVVRKIDSRLIYPTVDNVLSVRLLSFKSKESPRSVPHIIRYTHNIKEEAEDGTVSTHFALCQSTPYLKMKDGLTNCPLCALANKYYNKSQDKSLSKDDQYKAKKLYNTFKRSYNFVIPVYVLNDKKNPDNIGKVKVLLLNNKFDGNSVRDLINAALEHNEIIFNQFSNLEAFNLRITAVNEKYEGSENEYRKVAFEFVKTPRKIFDISADESEEFNKKFYADKIVPLKYDVDFFTPYDEVKFEEVQKKVKKAATFISKGEQPPPTKSDTKKTKATKSEGVELVDKPKQTPAQVKVETKKVEAVVEAISIEKPATPVAKPLGNITNIDDIDDIIASINANLKK